MIKKIEGKIVNRTRAVYRFVHGLLVSARVEAEARIKKKRKKPYIYI